jgi:hypothetical protein
LHHSGDELFTKFREQNYIELLNHQMKTPLAVRPVFLKSPRRVESLVTLLQIALQIYQVLERRYRQTVPADAPANEQRMTAEALLRQFRVYGCVVTSEKLGQVVHATRLTSRQRQILNQLSLATPAQTLRRILQPVPTGQARPPQFPTFGLATGMRNIGLPLRTETYGILTLCDLRSETQMTEGMNGNAFCPICSDRARSAAFGEARAWLIALPPSSVTRCSKLLPSLRTTHRH